MSEQGQTTMHEKQTSTSSIIAAVEVWTPRAEGDGLELNQAVHCHAGYAEALPDVGHALLGGEGLPGQVWSREVPLLIEAICEQEFPNAAALTELGLGAVLALPFFDHDKVGSVLVVYFAGGEGRRAAVEMWTGRGGHHELATTASYYPGLERFGAVSQYVHFPMGSGLPGQVWQNAKPQLIDGLSESANFLRSTGASNEGLTLGFGFPLIRGLKLCTVLLTLESDASAFASVYEVWEPALRGQAAAMQRTAALCPSVEGFGEDKQRWLQPGEGLVGKAWASRRPELSADLGSPDDQHGDWDLASHFTHGLALPVLVADEVRSVAMLAW